MSQAASIVEPDPWAPMMTTCPNCETEILTRTPKFWEVWKVFWCFTIPVYCTCQNHVLHTCPQCNYVIKKYTQEWLRVRRIKYIKYNIISSKIDYFYLILSCKDPFNWRHLRLVLIQTLFKKSCWYFGRNDDISKLTGKEINSWKK